MAFAVSLFNYFSSSFCIPFHSARSFYEKKRPDRQSSVLPCPTKKMKKNEGHDGPKRTIGRTRRHARHHHHHFSALQRTKMVKGISKSKSAVNQIGIEAKKNHFEQLDETNGNYSSPRRKDVNESCSQIKIHTHRSGSGGVQWWKKESRDYCFLIHIDSSSLELPMKRRVYKIENVEMQISQIASAAEWITGSHQSWFKQQHHSL